MSDHEPAEWRKIARRAKEAWESGVPANEHDVVDLAAYATEILFDADNPPRTTIPDEWRIMLRDLRQDVEVLERARNRLLNKIDDMRAEGGAERAELKRLRARIRKEDEVRAAVMKVANNMLAWLDAQPGTFSLKAGSFVDIWAREIKQALRKGAP